MRWMLGAVALAVSVVAGPALAQDGHFTAGGKTMRVPAPSGYCAEGKAVDAYMTQQQAMPGTERPDVVMMRCEATEASFDFYALRAVRGQRMTLPALLADLRRTLPAAQAQESLVPERSRAAMAKQLSDMLSTDVKIDTGIKPVGVDDVCGYIAGAFQMQAGGRTLDATIIGCITVIGDQVTYLFRYVPGRDRDAAIAALPELRTMALAIGPEK